MLDLWLAGMPVSRLTGSIIYGVTGQPVSFHFGLSCNVIVYGVHIHIYDSARRINLFNISQQLA